MHLQDPPSTCGRFGGGFSSSVGVGRIWTPAVSLDSFNTMLACRQRGAWCSAKELQAYTVHFSVVLYSGAYAA